MKAKFEDAAYSVDGINYEYVTIEELISFRTEDSQGFIRKYDGNLYCSECHTPQLSFVDKSKKRNYHLRTYPKQYHELECSKIIEYVDTSVLNECLNDEKSFDFINSKLERVILNKFFKKQDHKASLVKVANNKIVFEEINETHVSQNKSIKQIPMKSLTAPFDEDDFNTYKIFYGNVDIQLCKRKSDEDVFYSLQLYRKDSKFAFCSITMNEDVKSYLENKYHLKTEERYNDVCISFCSKLRLKGKYVNGRLDNLKFCVIMFR